MMKNFYSLLRYVSDMNEILRHPYFVNIGLPNNYHCTTTFTKCAQTGIHISNTNEPPSDITYASLSIGMYVPKWDPETWGKNEILEEKIFFGPVHMITNGKALAYFLWNEESANNATYSDLIDNVERLRTEIFGYLLAKYKKG